MNAPYRRIYVEEYLKVRPLFTGSREPGLKTPESRYRVHENIRPRRTRLRIVQGSSAPIVVKLGKSWMIWGPPQNRKNDPPEEFFSN